MAVEMPILLLVTSKYECSNKQTCQLQILLSNVLIADKNLQNLAYYINIVCET